MSKSNWEFLRKGEESALEKRKSAVPSIDQALPVPDSPGTLERMQTGRITRKARVAASREEAVARLEAFIRELKAADEVHASTVDLRVEEALERIQSQHVQNLTEIGIANVEARAQALRDLSVRIARQLKEAFEDDVPEFMRDRTVEAIKKEYFRLLDRISSEEIRQEKQG